MKLEIEVVDTVISIAGVGDDGYRCGFDIALTDKTPEGRATYAWLFPKIEAIQLQVAEVPEKRGELRKKPKPEALDALVELEPIHGGV